MTTGPLFLVAFDAPSITLYGQAEVGQQLTVKCLVQPRSPTTQA